MMMNKDMPAMPTQDIDSQHSQVDYGGGRFAHSHGITKLEHFAGLAIPPMEIIINAMKQCNGSVNIDDYIDYAIAYKIKEAKALLTQLEGESDE